MWLVARRLLRYSFTRIEICDISNFKLSRAKKTIDLCVHRQEFVNRTEDYRNRSIKLLFILRLGPNRCDFQNKNLVSVVHRLLKNDLDKITDNALKICLSR